MILSRALRAPGSSEAVNQTTPFVDQNQTYTSHPSHQAFLREYTLVGGIPQPTGRVLDGVGGNIGNWADVKANALTNLGIALVDAGHLQRAAARDRRLRPPPPQWGGAGAGEADQRQPGRR